MIDKLTVQRIMDTADIVDVVSDYVSLRKAGASYKGLCPFHDDRTPSFYVSPSRGICHCFTCGKGGNAAGFLMEIEQISYPEALRRLAKKYNIEIEERQLTDEERRHENDRESMFIINEWASKYFQDILHNDPDGTAVGMAYFRGRGFRDDMIAKFHLGFDPADRLRLAAEAKRKGYNDDYLVSTGLCYRNDHGQLIDRFAGRVVFPWMNRSGRVVGFTARVLDSRTKGVNQKYVNSPDSDIFHKGNELYGIYQARTAIHKADKVFLVEGQADVISMHQSGIENVVAGSGTALTRQQILLLKRYTNNITLIYDDDEAGHHAALKGTDEILVQGMNLRILLLPGGMDPDEFARSHTADEMQAYISGHETDFIQFKTQLLVSGVNDPVKRTEGINSVLKSVSLVTDNVLRDTYIHDCSRLFGIGEQTLFMQMNEMIRENRDERRREQEREANREAAAAARDTQAPQQTGGAPAGNAAAAQQPEQPQSKPVPAAHQMTANEQVEWELIKIVVRYGERPITVKNTDGADVTLPVAQYIAVDLGSDGLKFHNDLFNTILADCNSHLAEQGFAAEQYFVHHADIRISQLAVELSVDRYQLSKSMQVEMTPDRLRDNTLRLVLTLRMEYVNNAMQQINSSISTCKDNDEIMKMMQKYSELTKLRNSIAKLLGSNLIMS